MKIKYHITHRKNDISEIRNHIDNIIDPLKKVWYERKKFGRREGITHVT